MLPASNPGAWQGGEWAGQSCHAQEAAAGVGPQQGAVASSTAGCGAADLILLPGQQNIYFTYQRCLFFWPPTHLAITLT